MSLSQAQYKYAIQGSDTLRRWIKKYGILDPSHQSKSLSMQTPQQKIQELEQKLRLLQRQNEFLENRLIESEDKVAILDKLIDLAEEEYLIPVRKTPCPISQANQQRTRKDYNVSLRIGWD